MADYSFAECVENSEEDGAFFVPLEELLHRDTSGWRIVLLDSESVNAIDNPMISDYDGNPVLQSVEYPDILQDEVEVEAEIEYDYFFIVDDKENEVVYGGERVKNYISSLTVDVYKFSVSGLPVAPNHLSRENREKHETGVMMEDMDMSESDVRDIYTTWAFLRPSEASGSTSEFVKAVIDSHPLAVSELGYGECILEKVLFRFFPWNLFLGVIAVLIWFFVFA